MVNRDQTGELRCGYCYEEFVSITDPKKLPCQHVFCLPCLQGDYRESCITCPTCQTICKVENLEELPMAQLASKRSADTFTSLMCNADNCEGSTADSYCIQCECYMCHPHQMFKYWQCSHKPFFTIAHLVRISPIVKPGKSHDTAYGDGHQVIPISTYQLCPGSYKRVICECHMQHINKTCTNCSKLFCEQCDINTVSCTDSEMQHNISLLDVVQEEITTHFNGLLKSVSDRLTEMCKLDKRAWRKLDAEEVEYKEMMEMIERYQNEQIQLIGKMSTESNKDNESCSEELTNQVELQEGTTNQVRLIREEGERLKKRVYEHERQLVRRVEVYNSELMTRKEQLEESRTKIMKLMKDSHVTEQIQQKEQMTEELRRQMDDELDSCRLGKLILINKAKHQPINLELISIPASLSFNSEHATWCQCNSAAFREDGSLVLGSNEGMKLLKQDGTLATTQLYPESVSVAIQHGRNIFTVVKEGKKSVVGVTMPDAKEKEKLFEVDDAFQMLRTVVVSNEHVLLTDANATQLILYDFSTKQTFTVKPEGKPGRVNFLPDGDLLYVCRTKNSLIRYRIENRQLTKVWTCEGLRAAHSLCADAHGFIYVCTKSTKTLYVVSPAGAIVQEIRHDSLPFAAGTISIKDDILAVHALGLTENCIRLFRMCH